MTNRLSSTRLAGSLDALTLQLQAEIGVTFALISSHSVGVAKNDRASPSDGVGTSRSPAISQRDSKSLTPSPQKQQRFAKAQLRQWRLRLCQLIDVTEQAKADQSDSDTEDEDDVQDDKQELICAWYSVKFNGKQAKELCKEANVEQWSELESQIRSAWDQGEVDILSKAEDRQSDATYSKVCVQFSLSSFSRQMFQSSKAKLVKQEEDLDQHKTNLYVHLNRLDVNGELCEASQAALELTRAFGALRNRTMSLTAERDSQRKLLHQNHRHERFKEASTSLINPGRIKRKLEDDAGFEDD